MSAANRDFSVLFSRDCNRWKDGRTVVVVVDRQACPLRFESLDPSSALLMGWEREGCLAVQNVNFRDCARLQK